MYYTIYKITNLVNGKFYIGSHKTKDLDDGYMGSGKYLKHSQEKYGLENFTKEILFVFDNPEEMYAKEAEIVNEDFLAEENTYNLKIGGFGGWDYINSSGLGNSTKTKTQLRKGGLVLKEKWKNDKEFSDKMRKIISSRAKKLHSEGKLKSPGSAFLGKTHTEETKKRIGKASSIRERGEGNSQYGTKWCVLEDATDLNDRKKFKEIPEGWITTKEWRERQK